ncbi:hypothetical protein ELH24_21720 [Rhizobium ruizarguesonis]|nr:hypothetical protein ELH25_25440 [Rhizobium ruizarguesonis]TBD17973.1 hypothetical protein ELH24_21720 [Rhizobium ruizarguesonis]TBE99216.1 hypothetical protein ELG98_22835 [Rhizobium ruizarguesonis]
MNSKDHGMQVVLTRKALKEVRAFGEYMSRIEREKGLIRKPCAAGTLTKSAIFGWRRVHFQEWCPREDSNLRPQDSYHFGFSRRPEAFVVWTVPSP